MPGTRWSAENSSPDTTHEYKCIEAGTEHRRRTCDRAAAIVVLAFLLIGGLYSVTTPPFEASDELSHYPFVKHLADGSGLPVLGPGSVYRRYRQEGGQPPLYYALGALATFWIDTGAENDVYQPNPHATIGVPLRSDNKNMVIHTSREDFPYAGVILALHLVRFLSVLMGAATVYITYLIGIELFPREPFVALAAAVFNAFLPEFLFVSGSINNDNLVTLLCSAALLLAIRAAKGHLSWRGIAALSIVVGLAPLAKLSGLALFPLVGLVAVAAGIRGRRLAPFARLALPVGVSSAVIAGWWYVRNWQLYGDPTGLNAFLRVVGERSPKPGLVELLVDEGEGLRLSFWGVFGGFNVLAPPFVYTLFDALSILSLAGLVVYAVLPRVRSRFGVAHYAGAYALIWLLVIAASFLRWTQMTLASQGRLIFPALSIISALFALGICSLAPRRFAPYLVGVLAASTMVASASVPFTSILPAYPRPALIAEEDARGFQRALGIDFAGKVRLIGMDLSPERIVPGEDLTVSLYLSSLSEMDQDYSIYIHVFDGSGETVGQMDSYPGRGALPTSLWVPGRAIVDTYSVPIEPSTKRAGVLRVVVGIYDLRDMAPLAGYDPHGKPLGTAPAAANVKLLARDAIKPLSQNMLGRLGGEVGLVGHRVETQTVAAGSVLRGSLTWQALRKVDRDYSVFVQLVGGNGLAAQYDSYPRQGTYPTSFWDEGEVVEDSFEMKVGPGIPEGDYDLIAGMYDLATGARLAAGSDTFVRLQKIQVRGRPNILHKE